MRTSLTETEQIENLILKTGEQGDRLLTEAKLQLDPDLKSKARWQAKTYELVRIYGREKLQHEIRMIENTVFTSKKYSAFQQGIRSIFNF